MPAPSLSNTVRDAYVFIFLPRLKVKWFHPFYRAERVVFEIESNFVSVERISVDGDVDTLGGASRDNDGIESE